VWVFIIESPHQQFHQLAANDIELSVRVMLDGMDQTMVKGSRVEIRDLGSSGLNYRAPRNGRNPKTAERVSMPGKYVPHFKPGNASKNRRNVSMPVFQFI